MLSAAALRACWLAVAAEAEAEVVGGAPVAVVVAVVVAVAAWVCICICCSSAFVLACCFFAAEVCSANACSRSRRESRTPTSLSCVFCSATPFDWMDAARVATVSSMCLRSSCARRSCAEILESTKEPRASRALRLEQAWATWAASSFARPSCAARSVDSSHTRASQLARLFCSSASVAEWAFREPCTTLNAPCRPSISEGSTRDFVSAIRPEASCLDSATSAVWLATTLASICASLAAFCVAASRVRCSRSERVWEAWDACSLSCVSRSSERPLRPSRPLTIAWRSPACFSRESAKRASRASWALESSWNSESKAEAEGTPPPAAENEAEKERDDGATGDRDDEGGGCCWAAAAAAAAIAAVAAFDATSASILFWSACSSREVWLQWLSLEVCAACTEASWEAKAR